MTFTPCDQCEILGLWDERLRAAQYRLTECLRRGPCAIGTYDARRDVAEYARIIKESEPCREHVPSQGYREIGQQREYLRSLLALQATRKHLVKADETATVGVDLLVAEAEHKLAELLDRR